MANGANTALFSLLTWCSIRAAAAAEATGVAPALPFTALPLTVLLFTPTTPTMPTAPPARTTSLSDPFTSRYISRHSSLLQPPLNGPWHR